MNKTAFGTSRFLTLLVALCLSTALFAQQRTISGTLISRDTGQTIPGASVLVQGTHRGVVSDANGNFSLLVAETDTLVVTYIGYLTRVVPVRGQTSLVIHMELDMVLFDEIVVIGYGMQRRGDLTGAISVVSSDDFNQGVITSPEQLIKGRVSGVQIISQGGSPSAGNAIRIRGGASLSASNDPLIVLDGVPLEHGGISGNANNFLSLVNPNDIESITVLKDAAASAIYGSRASNGVILITTKRGSGEQLRVTATATRSVLVKTRDADMLSTGEFRQLIETRGTSAQVNLLGNHSTNWTDEIFRIAGGTDINASVDGSFQEIPLRLSLGYFDQEGILLTDNVERLSGSLSLSPSFFENNLDVNLGVRASLNNNRFANSTAIWGGATFNPTLPVMSGLPQFGGYTEAILPGGNPVTAAVLNPVGLLNQFNSTSEVSRVIANVGLDYTIPSLPGLRLHATVGYDVAQGQGRVLVPQHAVQYFMSGGRDFIYGPEELENRLLTTYFNYNAELPSINSTIDITGGYDYQAWKSTRPAYNEYNIEGVSQNSIAPHDQRHVLVSFYGRVNYSLASRYMLTATLRRDGTSRFGPGHRWGMFPSIAVAWRLSQENFLAGVTHLSNLKIRASFGVTGQQEGIPNYGFMPIYTISQPGAQYIFGNTPVFTFRPEAYVADLKWESTEALNLGLDFGFFNNRLAGAIEYYARQTSDLLARVPAPAGTNFDNVILTNVGNVDSEGVELSIQATPVDNRDWSWDLGFNATWLTQTIRNLSLFEGAAITNTLAGPMIDTYYYQVLTEGYSPYMFYLFRQLYDQNRRPIEGAFADLDGDGQVNSNDLYRNQSPAPDYILGFSTSLRYRDWSLGTSLRANIGNYVFNGMAMNTGAFGTVSFNAYQLNNLHRSFLETGFQSRQYLSDHYLENASFLKMDNITLNYNFGRIRELVALNISAMVQNVFTITKYTGVDPEVPGGMDLSFYPRPRVFSLSVGLEF